MAGEDHYQSVSKLREAGIEVDLREESGLSVGGLTSLNMNVGNITGDVNNDDNVYYAAESMDPLTLFSHYMSSDNVNETISTLALEDEMISHQSTVTDSMSESELLEKKREEFRQLIFDTGKAIIQNICDSKNVRRYYLIDLMSIIFCITSLLSVTMILIPYAILYFILHIYIF